MKAALISFSKLSPFSRLIYPMPEKAGLGVHLTRTIDGAVWVGPTIRYHYAIADAYCWK
jgi:L-2-hydroxyglutarate oxidase LhgO